MKTQVSKENQEMLQRIKDFTCTALNLNKYESWESGLTRALSSNAFESINFMRPHETARLLFMPHSPGIYIALVLKNADEID